MTYLHTPEYFPGAPEYFPEKLPFSDALHAYLYMPVSIDEVVHKSLVSLTIAVFSYENGMQDLQSFIDTYTAQEQDKQMRGPLCWKIETLKHIVLEIQEQKKTASFDAEKIAKQTEQKKVQTIKVAEKIEALAHTTTDVLLLEGIHREAKRVRTS